MRTNHRVIAGVFTLVLVVGVFAHAASAAAATDTGQGQGTSIGSLIQHVVCAYLWDCGSEAESSTATVATTHNVVAERTSSTTIISPVYNIVTNPIVERIVQSRSPSSAQPGVSAAYVDAQFAALSAKLQQGLSAFPLAQPTPASAVQYVPVQTFAQGTRIDQLSNTVINTPTIKGGSLSDVSIGASSLDVSGDTALSDTTVSGTLSINGSEGQTSNFFDIRNASGTIVFAVQHDGTLVSNFASTTQSVSELLVTGNATATNMIILNTASTSNFIAANATTTNATTTNASITNLAAANATSTNSFATTASSTNLYSTNGAIGVLAAGSLSVGTLGGSAFSSLTANYVPKWNTGAFANSMIFDSGSQVGIGTTSPWKMLSVAGDIIGTNITATGTLSVAGNATLLGASSTNLSVIGTAYFGASATSSFNGSGILTLANATNNTLLYANGSKQVVSASVGGSLIFSGGTLALNTANPNTFTALQQFANSTSTMQTVTQKAYFGTSGQSAFDFNGALILGTPLSQVSGGTGIGAFSVGDILYADGSGILQRLPVGSTGNVLTVQAGLPAWGVTPGGGGGGANDVWATTTNDLIIYPTNTMRSVVIGANASSSANSIFEVHGQSYFSSNIGIASTSPATTLSVAGSGYLTGGLGVGTLNTAAGTLQTSGNATIGGTLLIPSLATNSILYSNGFSQVGAASVASSLTFSGGSLALNTSNANTFSALQQFNAGFTAYASSSVGDGTQAGGLTIFGGATTTGNAYMGGTLALGGPGSTGGAGTGVTLLNYYNDTANKQLFIADSDNLTSNSIPAFKIALGAPRVYFQSETPSGSFMPFQFNDSFAVNQNGGIAAGADYVGTTPPTNGAIVEGNVGIGTVAPTALLHTVTTDNANSAAYNLGNNVVTAHVYNTLASTTVTTDQSLGFSNFDYLQINPTGSLSQQYTNRRSVVTIPNGNTQAISSTIFGNYSQMLSYGSGFTGSLIGLRADSNNIGAGSTVANLTGVQAAVGNSNLSSQYSTTTAAAGFLASMTNSSTNGLITSRYGAEITASNSGTITNDYGFYASGIGVGGTVTNKYDFYGADTGAYNYFGGNVGIGTTTPIDLLSVGAGGTGATDAIMRLDAGSGGGRPFIRFGLNSSVKALIGAAGGASSLTPGSVAGDLVFRGETQKIMFTTDSGATSALTIGTNSNVGVGTTSPDSKLSVDVGSNQQVHFRSGSHLYNIMERGNAGQNDLAVFATGSTYNWAFGLGDDSSNNLYLTTNLSTPSLGAKMTLTTAGNVGIGTTTPGEVLAANGAIQFGNATISSAINNYNSGRIGAYDSSTDFIQPSKNKYLEVWSSNSNTIARFGKVNAPTDTTSYFAGNVGIGTTTPQTALHVFSSTASVQLRIESLLNTGVNAFVSRNDTGSQMRALQNGSAAAGSFITTLADSAVLQGSGTGGLVLNTAASAPMIFSTGGTAVSNERMRIDSSGNVGIGTTTPQSKLHVFGSGTQSIILEDSTSGGNRGGLISGMWGANGLGLDSYGTSSGWVYIGNTGGSTGNAAQIRIKTAATDRMFLDSSGNIGIGGVTVSGTTFSAASMDVTSSGNVYVGTTTNIGSSDAGLGVYFNNNTGFGINIRPTTNASRGYINFIAAGSNAQIGSISAGSDAGPVAFNTTSDRRLKENIATTTIGLSTLVQIPVRDFDFIVDPTHSKQQGFIAQELYPVYPYAVTTNGDNGTVPLGPNSVPWQVDYGRMTPLLVRSIQDLNTKVDSNVATTTALAAAAQLAQDQFDAIVGSVTASTSPTAASYANSFFSSLHAHLTQWFANASNGIHDLYATIIHADEVHAKELCAQKSDGTEVCVTGDQLATVLAGLSATSTAPTTPNTASSTVSITVLGNNPAHVDLNASYADLGATASTTDQAITNLGVRTYQNGAEVSGVTIDTSTDATYEIEYKIIDGSGTVLAQAARTVIVGTGESSATSTSETFDTGSASSTDATSTTP